MPLLRLLPAAKLVLQASRRGGEGQRFRSLGCWPCTKSVVSDAKDVQEIIVELKSGRFANIAERSGRAQDKDDGGGLESLRRDGYM